MAVIPIESGHFGKLEVGPLTALLP
jgi:hypothetical protein